MTAAIIPFPSPKPEPDPAYRFEHRHGRIYSNGAPLSEEAALYRLDALCIATFLADDPAVIRSLNRAARELSVALDDLNDWRLR